MSKKNLEMVAYVLRYATYALEDSLLDFRQDVMDNESWTKEQADEGYTMLEHIIASLECHIAIVTNGENGEEEGVNE